MKAFEASGLPGTQWCRTQDIPIKQFRYWRKKLRRLAGAKAAPNHRWTLVSAGSSAAETGDALLWIVCGSIKIEIHEPFNPKLLHTRSFRLCRHHELTGCLPQSGLSGQRTDRSAQIGDFSYIFYLRPSNYLYYTQLSQSKNQGDCLIS